jgi:tetratricopeptide (TPR) repeat protein
MHVILALSLALAADAQDPVIQVQGPDGASSTIATAASEDHGLLDKAYELIIAKKPAEAVPVLDGIIARAEARYAQEKRQLYAARSQAEAILYAGLAASQKKSALVLDDTWSNAYFFKGFALIDLNRSDESKALFDRAIAMAPMNSQYLGERGEWYKSHKDWERAYTDFEAAAGGAEFSPDELKSFHKRRAWRGMAFVRTEQRRLNEAEALLRQCLALDPKDLTAQHELEYIKSLRGSTS